MIRWRSKSFVFSKSACGLLVNSIFFFFYFFSLCTFVILENFAGRDVLPRFSRICFQTTKLNSCDISGVCSEPRKYISMKKKKFTDLKINFENINNLFSEIQKITGFLNFLIILVCGIIL